MSNFITCLLQLLQKLLQNTEEKNYNLNLIAAEFIQLRRSNSRNYPISQKSKLALYLIPLAARHPRKSFQLPRLAHRCRMGSFA